MRPIGMHARFDGSFDDAVVKVTDALKTEGFGVLTEIDVQATLKKKLDVDFRRYKILGACNPAFAHRALQTSLDVGLLPPVQRRRLRGGRWFNARDRDRPARNHRGARRACARGDRA